MSGRTLYIKQKVISLHDKFTVKDAQENDVYSVQAKTFSLHGTIAIYNPAGEEVASIHKERLTIHYAYKVMVNGKKYATITKKLLTIGGDHYDVSLEKGSLTASGSIFDHNFKVKDGSSTVGHVKKSRLSWGDSYELNIDSQDPELELLLVGLVLAIDTVDAEKK